MNNDKLNLVEDAKDDWLDVVNKHKKKQKGLPALSILNTNAGNVEKNIEIFNAMQPDGSASIDAANGNVEVSASIGESLETENTTMNEIILHYENLPIEVVTKQGNSEGRYDYSMGGWYPDEDETEERLIDWDFAVTAEDVVEALQDDGEVLVDVGVDYDTSEEEFFNALLAKVDYLSDKYADKLKDYFYEEAIADAEKKYDAEESYLDYADAEFNLMREDLKLDDQFDMSMRTLL